MDQSLSYVPGTHVIWKKGIHWRKESSAEEMERDVHIRLSGLSSGLRCSYLVRKTLSTTILKCLTKHKQRTLLAPHLLRGIFIRTLELFIESFLFVLYIFVICYNNNVPPLNVSGSNINSWEGNSTLAFGLKLSSPTWFLAGNTSWGGTFVAYVKNI